MRSALKYTVVILLGLIPNIGAAKTDPAQTVQSELVELEKPIKTRLEKNLCYDRSRIKRVVIEGKWVFIAPE